jgi:hypothetical protein
LAAWLKELYPDGAAAIMVRQENFRKRFDAVRQKAGFSVNGSKGMPWPHNALRHSFGSYHLAHFKNAAMTALEMGHVGTGVLFRHYRARVSDLQAAAWWQLMPEIKSQTGNAFLLPPPSKPLADPLFIEGGLKPECVNEIELEVE